MAQQFVTDNGTLIIPGAYATYKVQTDNSGLSATGILMLVGEADAGPDHTLEDDLEANAFGPDQAPEVLAKYRGGALVDAFRAASAPANDPNIVGSPSRIILVKTNPSTKAKVAISKIGGGTYGYLADKSYGKLGNLIYAEVVAKQSEVVPTTGAMTFIPNVGTVAYEIRANGGAAVGGTLGANTSPAAFASAIDALAGVTATGGADRSAHPASGNLSVAVVSGNTVQIDSTVALGATVSVGDTVVIPDGSVIAGGSDQNVGAYVVISATTTQIIATKLSDAGKTGASAGTITAPAAVVATAVSGSPADDIKVFAPVVISLDAADPIDGVGKSLELAQLTTGTDLLERTLFALNTTPVSFVSKSSAAKVIVSAAEYIAQLNIARQADAVQEEIVAGGEVALKIGYKGTTAAVVISDTAMTITVAGGTGSSLSLDLKDFPTLNDLATFINSKAGFKCSVGSGILGQLPSKALDDVNTTCASAHGAETGRLKVDAYKLFKKLSEEGVLCQLQDADGVVGQAAKGLPAPQAVQYLDGGAKGSTSSAAVLAAIDALEKVRGNFLVPLFSRDAADDVLDGLTESGSTYAIDSIHAACRTHVLKMSTLKRRRNRQAFLSHAGTFSDAMKKASDIASFRCAMTFQDVKNLATDGTIKQFQPWMSAVIAAGMQAAGFYRPIVHKVANISGALQAKKDFDDRNDSQLENALLAGLLPLRRADTGGFIWVSDQTTYGKDSNFVFNSIQATYIADVIAMTTAQRMERAFVGQSLADVSAALAMAFLEGIMGDFLRLKLIAASDGAPRGFKNARIQIKGPAMIVSAEIKLAGALYFIPINFLVSQVEQSA